MTANLLTLKIVIMILRVITGRREAVDLIVQGEKFLDKPPVFKCQCGRVLEATDWE